MKVSEVMTRDVQTVRPDQPVQQAASFMHHVLSKLGVSGRDALAEMPGPALEVVPMSASPVR